MDPSKPVMLDWIQDPEVGLALLTKRPASETPEQSRKRLFWQIQFEQWRSWRAGDTLAYGRAVACCALLNRAPPNWLRNAAPELCERIMPADEKRAYADMWKHQLRWKAVLSARGRGLSWEESWPAAAETLAGTDAAGGSDAVKASYALIQDAGGEATTLASYRASVARRNQRRKKPG